MWTIADGKRFFKGGTPNEIPGKPVTVRYEITDEPAESGLRLSDDDLSTLAAEPGDLLYVSDVRKQLGGLRSLHIKAGASHTEKGKAYIPRVLWEESNMLTQFPMRVEKIM